MYKNLDTAQCGDRELLEYGGVIGYYNHRECNQVIKDAKVGI